MLKGLSSHHTADQWLYHDLNLGLSVSKSNHSTFHFPSPWKLEDGFMISFACSFRAFGYDSSAPDHLNSHDGAAIWAVLFLFVTFSRSCPLLTCSGAQVRPGLHTALGQVVPMRPVSADPGARTAAEAAGGLWPPRNLPYSTWAKRGGLQGLPILPSPGTLFFLLPWGRLTSRASAAWLWPHEDFSSESMAEMITVLL